MAWIIYAFTHIFGTNEFGTRFFFVLLIFFSGLLIYRITRHLYGTEEPAFFAAFLFHILPITQFAVLAKTDILFLFFFLLVAHAALQGDLILLALALGLTFLSKLLAPFVVLSVLLYFL
ncbi:MAG TPA: glycosyltransferase family 39 protein, partial [bacterium]|nr:glycosyltransferase family 39 protein [bacterium]